MRTAWVALNLIVATIPLSIVIIVNSIVRGPDRIYTGIPRFWARWMLWASGVDVQLVGVENLAADRPQILTPNHASWYDVLVLAAYMPKRYRFVGKKELTRVPLWGRAWQASGHIAIDRGDTRQAVASLDRAAALVRADNSAVIIFPEGTRTETGELQPFKKGAFMLAVHSGLEVVPVGISGTFHIFNRRSWRVRSGPIIVRFGRPIAVTGFTAGRRDELMARVQAEMRLLIGAQASVTSGDDVRHHQHPRPGNS